ncbi:MAG: Rpp14 family protein [Amphiamblys sp. WSBS2006]|nr:MAG: Rpp14 family protein [Amphiamblys sp. WSBS2006]
MKLCKTRYIALRVELDCDCFVDPQLLGSLENALLAQIQLKHGDSGLGLLLSRFSVVYYSDETLHAILRVRRCDVLRGISALEGIGELTACDGRSVGCRIITLHTSGTARRCQKAIVDESRKEVSGKRRFIE